MKFSNFKDLLRYFLTGISFGLRILKNRIYVNLKLFTYRHSIKKLKVRRIHRDAFLVSTLTGAMCRNLLNRKLTERERESILFAGSLTFLYDKFFDDPAYNEKQLFQITSNPEALALSDNKEKCFYDLGKKLLECISFEKQFESACIDIFNAQVRSRKQEQIISINEIREITIEKGGTSSFFYASGIDHQFTAKQRELFFSFGTLIQLLDDIFDLHQDLIAHHNTLITANIDNPGKVIHILNEFLSKNFQILGGVLSTERKIKQLKKLYFFLAIPGFAYLDFLARESLHENLFEKNKVLKEKYCWKGWNFSKLLLTVRYILKNGMPSVTAS